MPFLSKNSSLECKDPQSKAIFLKSSQLVERLSEIVFTVLVKVVVQCSVLPQCIVSFGVYFITDSGSESFQLPVPFWYIVCTLSFSSNWSRFFVNFTKIFVSLPFQRFPFDWNNPIGYLIAVTLEYIILAYEFFVVACLVGLGIGANLLGILVIKDIQSIVQSINSEAKATKNQSNDLKILFSEHIDAQRVASQLSEF